jgi:glycosyltransferase involved in cell wall biosynthesis
MGKSVLASVIVPTYARPELVTEAVTSVLAQTLSHFEVIVVDDHGDPPAPGVWSDSRVRTVRLDANRGVAAARNRGAEMAIGEWLLFLDDDDLLAPRHLESLVDAGGKTAADIVTCWSRAYPDEGSNETKGRELSGNVQDEILDGTTPSLGAALVRRHCWLPFNESYLACEDLEWWLRVADKATFASVSEPLHLWRRHQGDRHGTGLEQRIHFSKKLLADRPDYFDAHPRASAFRWYRIGLMAARLGESRGARQAFLQSMLKLALPWSIRAGFWYARSWLASPHD